MSKNVAGPLGAGALGANALRNLQGGKHGQQEPDVGRREKLATELGSVFEFTGGNPMLSFDKKQLQEARQQFGYDSKSRTTQLEGIAAQVAIEAATAQGNRQKALKAEAEIFKGVGQAQKAMLQGGWFSKPKDSNKAVAANGKGIAAGLEGLATVAINDADIQFVRDLAGDLRKFSPEFATKYATQLAKVDLATQGQGISSSAGRYTPVAQAA